AAVLELPTNVPALDADAMLGAPAHGKYVVNGFAGVDDQWLIELSGLFTPSNEAFPSPPAGAPLARIYPLRYLVIRLADPAMSRESRQAWLGLRAAPPPGLQFRGTFEDTDLYGVFPLPEQGARIERMASYTFLLSHPHLRLVARPLTQSPKLEQWVEVVLNGRQLARVPLAEPVTLTARLTRRLSQVAPNVITLRHSYRPR